jgi:hypothetical protein
MFKEWIIEFVICNLGGERGGGIKKRECYPQVTKLQSYKLVTFLAKLQSYKVTILKIFDYLIK